MTTTSFLRALAFAGTALSCLAAGAAAQDSMPYREEFEYGPPAGWQTVSGSWTVDYDSDAGTSVFHAAPIGLARSVVGLSYWSDYAVTANVKVASWASTSSYCVGLLARYQGPDDYYLFTFNKGQLKIEKKQAGSYTTLASRPFTLALDQWYTMRAEVLGSALRFSVAGVPQLAAVDAAFALNHGTPGLASNHGDASFDSFLVAQTGAQGTIVEPFQAASGQLLPISGTWATSSGAYRLTTSATFATDALNNIAVHSQGLENDFTLTAKTKVNATSGSWDDFAIVFNYTDSNNYYFVSFNEGNNEKTRGIFRVRQGMSTELADIAQPIVAGTSYSIMVQRAGDAIVVRKDGVLQATAIDNTLVGGKVGFGSKGDTGVFDDLIVTTSTAPSWKVLMLVYSQVDFRFSDSTGEHHVVGSMTEADRARVEGAARRFFQWDVPALTSGAIHPQLTIRYPAVPLTRLSRLGTAFWPADGDTAADWDAEFDSIVVVWTNSGTDQATNGWVNLSGYGGLTLPRGTGQTYLAIPQDGIVTSNRNVFKHEWGHSILYYYASGTAAPQPAVNNHVIDNGAARYVNCGGAPYVLQDESDWAPIPNSIYNNADSFTRDYYSGVTALPACPNVALGIPPEAWATGGPVTR